MNVLNDPARFADILRCLRTDVGDIEFGFRVQGLFAHVLQRIGATVIDVRNQGHPDIIMMLGGKLARVEVEIASIRGEYHTIKTDDVEGVAPTGTGEQGYLAVLDIAEPVRWAPIEYSRLCHRVGRQRLATLHALAHRELARDCNDAFGQMIIAHARQLPALTYHLLRQRVLTNSA